MEINVDTKLVLFLGNPLGQSISSRVINRVYEEEGLNYIRIPVEIEEEDLVHLVEGMRVLHNLAGFNVTKPHKIAILPYLDELDPLAEKIGAVNCVVCREGRWKGYNTDSLGFLKALEKETGRTAENSTFFCLGAGGAGRAVCFALAEKGAERIFITDLAEEAAEELTEHLNGQFGQVAEHVPFTEEERKRRAIGLCDGVINASGIGMAPHEGETPVDSSWLCPGQIVFDAVYNPPKTRLLEEAEQRGCLIFNGREMLVNCNQIGYERITGSKAPKERWQRIMEQLQMEENPNRVR